MPFGGRGSVVLGAGAVAADAAAPAELRLRSRKDIRYESFPAHAQSEWTAEKNRAYAQSGRGIRFHKICSRFLRSDNYSAVSDSVGFPTSCRKLSPHVLRSSHFAYFLPAHAGRQQSTAMTINTTYHEPSGRSSGSIEVSLQLMPTALICCNGSATCQCKVARPVWTLQKQQRKLPPNSHPQRDL